MKKRRWGELRGLVLLLLLVTFLAATANLNSGQGEQRRLQLEEAIHRAAVTCYAVEGIYPPDLDYLRQHYGLQVDERHFDVFYEVFASNIMPDITVMEKEP